MKPNQIICILIILSSLQLSCKKLVEVEAPSDRIDRAMVFTNDGTALSAISGLYTQMIRTTMQFSSGGITVYAGLYADEIYPVTTSPTLDEYYNNALLASNATIRANLWLPAYQLIFQANNIIEGLATSTGLSPAVKNQLEGEAKFVRAFSHLYLVQLFGDVPLITSTDYRANAVLPRTPVNQVYDQIISDLQDAKSLTATTYPSSGRVRVNSLAASALLARVYLYKGEWQKAETESSIVIAEPSYTLSTTANAFLSTSTETIWQLMPVAANFNTLEGNVFVPAAGSAPAYGVTSSVMSGFATNDTRKANWTKTISVGGINYTYPSKYKVKTGATVTEYYIVLRLAEQYLIRAEARARQAKLPEAKADLNMIRSRAGLAPATATDIASLLSAIEDERKLELFAEWGHRFFDLNRTNRTSAVLGVKPGWNATDALWPIPLQELQKNPSLTQNPGY